MKIIHGTLKNYFKYPTLIRLPVYRNTTRIIPDIPVKLRKYLGKKFKKFFYKLKPKRPLEFTFGIDSESGISCIAVVHPKDQFSRKIGYSIVKGRILKYKNIPEECKNCIENEECYHQPFICKSFEAKLPDYMEVGKND